MRYALYARYSTDHQNARSTDDQLRLLAEHVAARGGSVVATFTDAALSGASTVNRPGLRALMAAARDGGFDIVAAEALDRLSRDQEDTAALFKRLAHAGIAIVTLAEGEISELHVGLKGTMNALFLKDLAAKIRRGQRGAIERGRVPGNVTYGYAVAHALDAKGQPVRGLRRIDEAKAAIIRRIYAEYAAGRGPRAIAAGLNADGVPSPTGRAWAVGCIIGNAGRAGGILHNEAYLGRLLYNRQSFYRDPDTGRRRPRLNPRGQWIVKPAPALRIVSDELWQAAQAIKATYRQQSTGPRRRRPKHLLAGLVVCGVCGGSYARRDSDVLACSNHKDRGTCANNRRQRIGALEAAIIAGLRDRLIEPDSIAAAVQRYHEVRQRQRRAAARTQATRAARRREVATRIGRLVAAIEDGTADAAVKARLMELGRERDQLDQVARHDGRDDTVIDLHPAFIARYRDRVTALAAALAQDEALRLPAAAIIRGMIGRITLTPHADGRPGLVIDLDAELEGLARLVRDAGGAARPPTEAQSAGDAGGASMVSKVCYRRNAGPALRLRL